MNGQLQSRVRAAVGAVWLAFAVATLPAVGRAQPLVVPSGETNTLFSFDVDAPPTTGLANYLDFNAAGGTVAYDSSGFVVQRNSRLNPISSTNPSATWLTTSKYGSGMQITAPASVSSAAPSRGVSPYGPTSWDGTSALPSDAWTDASYIPLSSKTPRTISAWVKPESFNTAAIAYGSSTQKLAQLFGYTGSTGKFTTGSGTWFGFYLKQLSGDASPRVVLSNASSYYWTAYSPGSGYYNQFIDVGSWDTLVGDGNYHLLTATWEPAPIADNANAGTAKVYLDGALVTSGSMDQLGASNFGISYAANGYGFAGATFQIDDVRAYNRAITAAEVSKTYLWDGVTTPWTNPYATTTELTVEAGGTFDLNGVSQQVASLDGGGLVTNGSLTTPADFKVYGSASTAFSGSVTEGTSAITLQKSGTGTLTLSGNNAYSGGTYVGQGKLVFTGANSGITGPMSVVGGTVTIGDGTNNTARAGSGAIAVSSYGEKYAASVECNFNAATTLANPVAVGNFGVLRNVGTGKVTINNDTAGNGAVFDGGAAGMLLQNEVLQDSITIYFRGNVEARINKAYTSFVSDQPGATWTLSATVPLIWNANGFTAANAMSINLGDFNLTNNSWQGYVAFNKDLTLRNGTFILQGGNRAAQPYGTTYIVGTANREAGGTGFLDLREGGRLNPVFFGNGGATGFAGNMYIKNGLAGTLADRVNATDPLARQTVSGVYFNCTTDNEYSGVMEGTGRVFKLASNTLTFSGTNTYTGLTTVQAGTLRIAPTGTIGSGTTSGVTVETGGRLRYDSTTGLAKVVSILTGGQLFYNSPVNYSGVLTFTNGTLGGTNWKGNLGGLTINTNRVISPGNSPGIAETTTQTWSDGGTYLFEVAQAGGTAGVGWDLVTGTDLTINSSATPFVVQLASLAAGNTSGPVADFNQFGTYSWLLADFANPIAGFGTANVSIDTSLFTNTFPAEAQFTLALGDTGSIGGDNTQLYMLYTSPVPEPAVLGLAGLGIAGLTLWLRRRRRS